jgi:molecular chaperone GrpE
MSLIYNKLADFLLSKGVHEVPALNEPFDADRHEAVTGIPAPSEDLKGKVVDVIQKGYVLHEKIIRYPKVVVGE